MIGAAGGIFILRHPALLLWMLVFSAPFNDYLYQNVGGLNVRPFALLAALGAIAIAWQLLARSTSRMAEIAWHYKGLIVIVALLVASKALTIYSLNVLPPRMTKIFCVKYVMFIALQFAASFVVACFIESPERLYQIVRGWMHVSNVVCLVAFVQLILANALGMDQYIWHREIISIGRPYSVFREPDVLGCYYAAFVVMLIPLLVAKVKFVSRPYLVTTLLTHSFFLVLIVVRGAWIAAIVFVALYVMLMVVTRRYHSVMPYLNGVLAVAVLAVMGLAMAAPSVTERIVGRFASLSNPTSESGSAYRIMELGYQFDMVKNPAQLTGTPMTAVLGYGEFSWSYWAPYVIPEDDFDQTAKTLGKNEVIVNAGFNMPLTVQFDNGLLGFGLYGVFFLVVSANFLTTLRRTHDPTRQTLLSATFLPVVAILVCYLFSYDPLFLTLWILLGIHLAAAYHVNRAESGVDEIGVPEPV